MPHRSGRCGVCRVAEPLGLRHVVIPGWERRTKTPRGARALEERFWQQVAGPWCEGVEEGDCWLWVGAPGGNGYGKLWAGERYGYQSPHRLALLLLDAQDYLVPPDRSSLEACHSCPSGDNGFCCNPAHLRWDTHQANLNDQIRRGRGWWQRSNGMGRKAYSEYLERQAMDRAAEAALEAMA